MKSVFSLDLKTCWCLGQIVDVKIKSHLILTNFPILWDLWDEFSLLPLQPKFSRDQSCYTYTHYLTWNPDWWPYPSSLNKWVSFPDPVAAKNTFPFLMKWHLIFYDQIQLIRINSTIFTSELPAFNDEPHFVCCSSAHHFPMVKIISKTNFPGFPHVFPMFSPGFPQVFPMFSLYFPHVFHRPLATLPPQMADLHRAMRRATKTSARRASTLPARPMVPEPIGLGG